MPGINSYAKLPQMNNSVSPSRNRLYLENSGSNEGEIQYMTVDNEPKYTDTFPGDHDEFDKHALHPSQDFIDAKQPHFEQLGNDAFRV